MSEPYPPLPPPPYAPQKQRPSAVTNHAMYLIIVGIVCIIVAVLEFVFLAQPWSYVSGAVTLIFSVLAFVDGLGLFMGQPWALNLSGWSNSQWAQAPDVREYFGLPPAYPAYASTVPPTAPPPPTCPTCRQPLTYIQQYQRWYCQNCQRYI
ncbi:MAG: hypothetical protein QW667_05595 [Candidatus Bathyarchaeia archaeon]